MNNRIVITDSNRMEHIIDNFNNIISNIGNSFENENNNFKKIDGTEVWSSNLQQSITSKYNELSSKYSDIIQALNTLSTFMTNSLNEYRKFESTLQSDMVDNSSNLDVNSSDLNINN